MISGRTKVYMWQNNMCITYTIVFKRFEDFFLANEWQLVEDPDKADWIFIGACAGFIPQIEQYSEKVKTLAPLKKRIAVYGCLPKVVPDRVDPSFLYIPSTNPEVIERMTPDPKVPFSAIQDPCGFRRQDCRRYDPRKKYVIIQYGCNATCIYCSHKIGIGPQVSRSKRKVLDLTRLAIDEGAHTIFLEGQDSGSWGTDFGETYLDILEPILRLPGDFEIHIGQFGGNWILCYGEKLLDAFSHPRITDIKIPIQSASPRLLMLMGRDARVREIGPFLKALRERKNINLRTDLIIGFPTETQEELDETLKFTNEHFEEVACFGFEIHAYTEIAEMDLPFHEEEVIEERVRYAMDFLERNPKIITHRGGQVYETLIQRERRKEKLWQTLIIQ